MIRLLALISFAYQSAAAIILVFSLSHILVPAEYTIFSLALASSQLLCVLMFEWLQLAGVRFLAAARGEDAVRLRSSLVAAALFSAVVLVSFGSVASLLTQLAPQIVVLGLALAVLQGLTDMLFMMIRVSDRLGTAALLLILRASLLLFGAVTGALLRQSTGAALLGILCGYATVLTIGWISHRMPLRKVPLRAMLADWADFGRYGLLAAGASMIHLTVPVTIRFMVVGSLGAANQAASAGFSMAIDLLQRPFAVLVAAIHTMNYPDAVVRFERGTSAAARQAIAQLFDFILCATIVTLGGIIGFLPDAGRLFVPAGILSSFLAAAPATAVFYFFHTHLQSTLAVIPHLRKSSLRLVVVAACQLILVSVFLSVAVMQGVSPSTLVAIAATATVLVILFAGGPTFRFGAFPRWRLIATATVAATVIGVFSMVPSELMAWLLGKVVVSALAVALITWQGGFLTPAKRAD